MKKIISILLLTVFAFMNFGLEALAYNSYSQGTKTEHLKLPKKVSKKTPTDIVVQTPVLTTIVEYNVIEVTFAENFSTKNAKVGEKIGFLLTDGLKTQEGSEILPAGSQVVATVTNVTKPKSFNRSGKVVLEFNEIVTPEGITIPITAKLFAKKDQLSRGKLNALGKGLGTTLGVGAIGVGAGCGIGVAAGAVIIGGFAIGLPVGIALGAALGLMTPGLHYKAKAGDKLLIQLTDNLEIQK